MILVEIRARGGAKRTVGVHAGVTVIGGLDAAARRTWGTDLARALRGDTAASLDVDVEVDGHRRPLTPALVAELGLADAASAVTVFAVDLPGAVAAPATAAPVAAPPDIVEQEAEVATAEATVTRLEGELAAAERAATEAAAEVTSAGRNVDREAVARVEAATARLEAARAASAAAQQSLEAAAAAAHSESEARSEEEARAQGLLSGLQNERSSLEAQRSELVGRMVEAGDPGDPAGVEQALAALRRLRSVKPKPSARAVALADAWVAANEKLASLPQPPQPPEWLVTPALAALHEARAALEAAEANATPQSIDPAKIEALDRAHREVLEAEQRAMKKGSRLNRRRLDTAHEAEQVALGALGVHSYGEYLQRIAPVLEDPTSGAERVAAARASLADAEAVWEELHGGEASPEWTAAKEEQAKVRTEALAVVGHDVDDADLEDALRNQLETVVDTGWAEQALATALRDAGAAPAPGADVEQAADEWLADLPGLREKRAALEAELSELDGRLAAVEEQLAEHQADAFFGDSPPPRPAPIEPGDSGPIAQLRTAAAEAAAAEREAEAALADAERRRQESEGHAGRRDDLERDADARRDEADRLRVALDEARGVVTRLRQDVERAPVEAPAPASGGVDLGAVVGMEAEAYLLARVASLRGVGGGPLPLVVDGTVLSGLSEHAARRVFRLLGRLAGSIQVVVLGDDDQITTWAEGLGDQAALRSAS